MVTALKSLLQFSAKEVFLYLYIFAVAQLGVYLTHVEMVGRSCEDGGRAARYTGIISTIKPMNRDPSLFEFLLIELLVFLTTGLIGLVLLKSSVHSNCLNSPNCHVPSVLLQTR